MKLFYYLIILFFLSGKIAYSNNLINFTQCGEGLETYLEGMNECVGSKCKKLFVHVVNPNLLSKQENTKIINLNQFEVEFKARVKLAAFMGTEVIVENNKTFRTIGFDPFKIQFEKKEFCETKKGNIKFLGLLKF